MLNGCATIDTSRDLDRKNQSITLYNTSVALVNSGQYKAALPVLESAVKADPSNMIANAVLGRTLIVTGNPKEGLKFLEKALTNAPKDPSVIIDVAYSYETLGQFSKAIEMFTAYQKLGGRNREDLAARIKALREQQANLDQITKRPGALSDTDYLAFVTVRSGISRWKEGTLRVYIDKSPAIRGRQQHFEQLVTKAFHSWEQASEGKLQFKQVSTPQRADITCYFVDDYRLLDSPIKEGETKTVSGLNGLRAAKIKILTVDRHTGQPESDAQIYLTALHEFGHALGLAGHSPNYQDVMFHSSGRPETERSLSKRDVATLRLLYSSEKPYMPPKGSKLEKQVEQMRTYNEHVAIYNAAIKLFNSKRYDDAIAQANEFLKVEPNADQGRDLIEAALNRQALDSIGKHELDRAESLLNQALSIKYFRKPSRARAVTKNNLKYLMQQKNATPE